MSNKILPHKNPILPFWRTELHSLDSHRTTDDLPTQCDILIVGAGYAGASTAFHLLQNSSSPPPSILILEAREACSGATGRNGGHLKPDVYFNLPNYIKQYGPELAAEIARFEALHVQAIKEVVEKEGIDCDFTLTRAIDVCLDEAQAREAKEAYDGLMAEGFDFVKDVQSTRERDAELISGVKGARACFSYTAGHIWPYKFVMHLLDLVVAKGVNLQTHTPVLSVSETPNQDERWVVQTPRGSVEARKVVFAANGYTSGIAPEYTGKIIPCRGICSRITTPKGKSPPHLSNSYVLRRGTGAYDYLIRRPDGSIVVGGARQVFMTDMKEWYENMDDSTLIESAKNYFDGYMQRHFMGWEDSGAYTDKVWTGVMGYTADSLPHVGEVPEKPGQFIVGGFNGHGMPVVFLSAKGIAEMIGKGTKYDETGLPRLFKTSKKRLESRRNDVLNLVPRL